MKKAEKQIYKYKIIKFLGFTPFIGVICYGIYNMIVGFNFLLATSTGLEALFYTIFILSFLLWPLYIIGIILIIISNKKLKNINNNNQ